jgi:cobalt-zinc-cadmium efflux system outer membrane protein
VEASDATALDLSVADGELSYWVQTRAEAELDRTAARARLSVAIADPALPFPDDATTVTLPTLRAPTVAALIDRVTAASPSARALGAEASYYAAAKERWQAEAFAPVNVVLTGGRGDLGDARFGGGLAWTFPIFRRNQAEIARAEAEGARALSERSIVEATTTIRARGLWEAYQTAARTLADLEEVALPSARRAVEATLASHRAGKTELSRVAAARRDLARAEGKRLDMVGSGFHVFAELTALVGEVP